MRRKEKKIIDRNEMITILEQVKYITIAMCKNDEPYLVTLSHGYDRANHCIYFHCAKEGKKIGILKEKLGPVLYQLPPSMHKDLGLLKDFLKLLGKRQACVFEFRHKSWFSQDCYELLGQFNASFCIHDLRGMEVPRIVTSDVIYVRFHGPSGRYAGNYSKAALNNWAEWIKVNLKDKNAAYAYFNNDYNAYAVQNAKKLKELII